MKTKLDISVLEAESKRLGKSASFFKGIQNSTPSLKNATAEQVIEFYHRFVFEQNQITNILQELFYEIQATKNIAKFCRFLVNEGIYNSVKGPEDLLTRAIFTNRTGRTPSDKIVKYRQIIVKYLKYKSIGKGSIMDAKNNGKLSEEERIEKMWREYQQTCLDKKISCGTKEAFETMLNGSAKPFTSDDLLEEKKRPDDDDEFNEEGLEENESNSFEDALNIEIIPQGKRKRGRPPGSKSKRQLENTNTPLAKQQTIPKTKPLSVVHHIASLSADPDIILITKEDMDVALTAAYKRGYETAKNAKVLSSEQVHCLVDNILLEKSFLLDQA